MSGGGDKNVIFQYTSSGQRQVWFSCLVILAFKWSMFFMCTTFSYAQPVSLKITNAWCQGGGTTFHAHHISGNCHLMTAPDIIFVITSERALIGPTNTSILNYDILLVAELCYLKEKRAFLTTFNTHKKTNKVDFLNTEQLCQKSYR